MSNATWQDQVVHYDGQTFTPQTDVTAEDYVGYDAIQTPTSTIEAQKQKQNRKGVKINGKSTFYNNKSSRSGNRCC